MLLMKLSVQFCCKLFPRVLIQLYCHLETVVLVLLNCTTLLNWVNFHSCINMWSFVSSSGPGLSGVYQPAHGFFHYAHKTGESCLSLSGRPGGWLQPDGVQLPPLQCQRHSLPPSSTATSRLGGRHTAPCTTSSNKHWPGPGHWNAPCSVTTEKRLLQLHLGGWYVTLVTVDKTPLVL